MQLHIKYLNGRRSSSLVRATYESLNSNGSKTALSQEQTGASLSRRVYERWHQHKTEGEKKLQRNTDCHTHSVLAGLAPQGLVQELQYQHIYQRDVVPHSQAATPKNHI